MRGDDMISWLLKPDEHVNNMYFRLEYNLKYIVKCLLFIPPKIFMLLVIFLINLFNLFLKPISIGEHLIT
jgi:hypothetical protein